MESENTLYCLGDIVHNDMEVNRLSKKGLVIIDREQLKSISDCKVLIRAHGEPPETYRTAIENNIELIDASCPVVLKLQHRVKTAFDKMEKEEGQIVIYGKKGHAENGWQYYNHGCAGKIFCQGLSYSQTVGVAE